MQSYLETYKLNFELCTALIIVQLFEVKASKQWLNLF